MPYVIERWHSQHPDDTPEDGLVLTQPWPAGPKKRDQRHDMVVYYQYKADRARRSLRGIDEQIAKAEKAVAGKIPVTRNRFVSISGGDKKVNRALEGQGPHAGRV